MGCCSSLPIDDDDTNGVHPMSPATLELMRRTSVEADPRLLAARVEEAREGRERNILVQSSSHTNDPRKTSISSVTRPPVRVNSHEGGGASVIGGDSRNVIVASTHSGASSVSNSNQTSPKKGRHTLAAHDRGQGSVHTRIHLSVASSSATQSASSSAAQTPNAPVAGTAVTPQTQSFATAPPSTVVPAGSSSTDGGAAAIAEKARSSSKKKKSRKSILTAPDAQGESQPVAKSNKKKAPRLLKAPVLSLEEEEDEKTARSLRNFEAENVLAVEAALLDSFHHISAEHSASPSPSQAVPPQFHAQTASRSLMGPYTFPSPSPLSGASASHTPRGGSSTPIFAQTPRMQSGATTPRGHLTVSTAYHNAEFLAHPTEAAMLTPGGRRTAMALLISGNQSARTSPRHSAQNSPRRPMHIGGGSLKPIPLMRMSSKTVPNSPRHSRSASPVATPRGTTMTSAAAAAAAAAVATPQSTMTMPTVMAPTPVAATTVYASLLAVPSSVSTPPPPPPANVSAGSSAHASAGPSPTPTHRLATRFHPRVHSHGGIVGGVAPSGPLYSRSVQTSPRHSRTPSGCTSEASSPHHLGEGRGGALVVDDLLTRPTPILSNARLNSASKTSAYTRFQARLRHTTTTTSHASGAATSRSSTSSNGTSAAPAPASSPMASPTSSSVKQTDATDATWSAHQEIRVAN